MSVHEFRCSAITHNHRHAHIHAYAHMHTHTSIRAHAYAHTYTLAREHTQHTHTVMRRISLLLTYSSPPFLFAWSSHSGRMPCFIRLNDSTVRSTKLCFDWPSKKIWDGFGWGGEGRWGGR